MCDLSSARLEPLEPLESQVNTVRAGEHYLRSDRVQRSAGDGDGASRGSRRAIPAAWRAEALAIGSGIPSRLSLELSRNGEGDRMRDGWTRVRNRGIRRLETRNEDEEAISARGAVEQLVTRS